MLVCTKFNRLEQKLKQDEHTGYERICSAKALSNGAKGVAATGSTAVEVDGNVIVVLGRLGNKEAEEGVHLSCEL